MIKILVIEDSKEEVNISQKIINNILIVRSIEQIWGEFRLQAFYC